MEETKIIYHIDDEETPYLVKLPIAPEKVTLLDFKNVLNRPNYKYFFKSMDDDFGVVKEEIVDDEAHLPCFNGRVVSWLVSAEGSNSSDRTSQCTDATHSMADKNNPHLDNHLKKSHIIHADDLTCTETESIISSRQAGHHVHQDRVHGKYDKYHKYNGTRLNGGRSGRGYLETPSSLLSSDLETTSFLESEEDDEDDASSRITTTTGRNTNISTDRNTVEEEEEEDESVSRAGGRRRAVRRRRVRAPVSRTSSYSSITDSTMSLNIITVTLNMDTVNFLGISIVGQSNKGGDGGIYVGSIMKGGAVALDGRIEPGDMILQVNDINFEDMSNDEAVRVLREVVQKPGPIKLVVAKCWDPNPKGYFTIPRTEPVRPIDPGAWVAHTAALRGETYPLRAPSVTTMSSNSSSITSSIPDLDRGLEELHLSVNCDMLTIVKAMARPDSGLEIRDRMWLKLTIPNAFIGADVVDWIETRVDGLQDKRDARKYAAQMLKAGYIRHTVNKTTFSEQCYYIFGDLLSTDLSELRLDEGPDDVGPLPPPGGALPPPGIPPPPGSWPHPYASTYLPPPGGPLPQHCYTNEPSLYAYTREESVHSGSGGSGGSAERAKTVGSGGTRSGGAPSRTSGSSGGSTATATATASPHHQPTQTDTTDRQSFRMAMGNPCFLDVDAL